MSHFAAWMGLMAVVMQVNVGRADEWPKWLGPNSNGISTDKIIHQWPADGPKKLWSHKVGLGFSSVVGLDGKVYSFAMQGKDDVLLALDAETGKVEWTQSYPVTHKADAPQGSNEETHLPLPEASPTIDGDRIYTYGGGADLYCRNLADGKEIWKLNVLDKTGATILPWNAASSPMVTDKLVYVQGGQGGPVAIAVDKGTGNIVWESAKGVGGYAAPILVTVGTSQQLIVFGGTALYGFDPQTGKTLWSYPWKTDYNVNASTPIYHDGHLFITTSYGHGCAMFTMTAAGVKLDWEGKDISSKYQPCILDNGLLYGNSNGRLKCMAWPQQKTVWSSNKIDLQEGGSFVIDGDQLIAMSEKGTLSLVHLAPSGATVASEVELFSYTKVWSSPVIYHGKLYVKGKDDLVCLDISEK